MRSFPAILRKPFDAFEMRDQRRTRTVFRIGLKITNQSIGIWVAGITQGRGVLRAVRAEVISPDEVAGAKKIFMFLPILEIHPGLASVRAQNLGENRIEDENIFRTVDGVKGANGGIGGVADSAEGGIRSEIERIILRKQLWQSGAC